MEVETTILDLKQAYSGYTIKKDSLFYVSIDGDQMVKHYFGEEDASGEEDEFILEIKLIRIRSEEEKRSEGVDRVL